MTELNGPYLNIYLTQLVHQFGCPTIDLFATQLNKKLKRYVSWFPDPALTEVDAFLISWDT